MDYRYKAFISYRHAALDKAIAEKLQKKLENYKPPKGMDTGRKWRIFRDETELASHANLSDGIKDALSSSEYLIVICSEEYRQSRWCMQELECFKELHNGSTDMIIPLVVSGRPEEVFPDELLTSAVLNPLTGEYEQQLVEPMAANISSKSLSTSLKLLNTKLLSIAAPMLNCSYDSLYLRERRRRHRRGRHLHPLFSDDADEDQLTERRSRGQEPRAGSEQHQPHRRVSKAGQLQRDAGGQERPAHHRK